MSDANVYSSELVNGFELSNDVLFPDETACISALRKIGINSDVPSYLEAKRIFGDSMMDSGNYRFWLAGPKIGAFGYNIGQLNLHWQESITIYQKSNDDLKRDWNIDNDKENQTLENWRRIRPFFCNTEYDSWYGWDTTKPGINGEYEIVVIDLQFVQVKGKYTSIVEIYEAIKAGKFDEEVKRNKQGKVILVPFPEN